MATCKCGDMTVRCRGKSCGCICEVDPPGRCWASCGGTTVEVPKVSVLVSSSDDGSNIDPGRTISVRSNGLSLGEVADMLNEVFDGEVLAPVGRLAEQFKLEVRGTITEICKPFGIVLRQKGDAHTSPAPGQPNCG